MSLPSLRRRSKNARTAGSAVHSHGRGLDVAVGEHEPAGHRRERVDGGLGVVDGLQAVRPVDGGGDAGLERLPAPRAGCRRGCPRGGTACRARGSTRRSTASGSSRRRSRASRSATCAGGCRSCRASRCRRVASISVGALGARRAPARPRRSGRRRRARRRRRAPCARRPWSAPCRRGGRPAGRGVGAHRSFLLSGLRTIVRYDGQAASGAQCAVRSLVKVDRRLKTADAR